MLSYKHEEILSTLKYSMLSFLYLNKEGVKSFIGKISI